MSRSARSRRSAVGFAFVLALSIVQVGGGPAESQEGFVPTHCYSSSRAVADLDGNGTDDLVVGSPGDDIGQQEIDLRPVPEDAEVQALNTGSINIIYSDKDGLHPGAGPDGAPRVIHGGTPGVQRSAQPGDKFGQTVAVGDFNGNGLYDLAVGAPGKFSNRGAVHVFYNQPGQGIRIGVPGTALFNQVFTQDTRFVRGSARPGNRFGLSLAVGDFNGDGTQDLAIGAPNDNRRGRNAGSVTILYGSPTGLNPQGPPSGGHVNNYIAPRHLREGGLFGWSLAAGDFLGNSLEDLAVGAPGRGVGPANRTGAVYVFHNGGPGVGIRGNVGPSRGTPEGSRNRFRFFHQDTVEMRGSVATGNVFGCSLAAGDFDGDGMDDLAIGIPDQRVGAVTRAGAVQVLYNGGPRYGLTATRPNPAHLDCPGTNCWTENQLWTENTGGIPGVAKFNDRFGTSLLSVDFDNDGVDDLVVGMPDEELYGLRQAGSVRVMQGFPNFGLTDRIDLNRRALAFAQKPPNPSESSDYISGALVVDADDRYGAALAAGDFNGSGFLDLAVGVPHESVGGVLNYLFAECSDQLYFQDEEFTLGDIGRQTQSGAVEVISTATSGLPAERHLFNPNNLTFYVLYRETEGNPRPQEELLLGDILEICPADRGVPHPGNTQGDRFGAGL